MVVHDLNFSWTICRPDEAHAPLLIDPYAVLPLAIVFQCLEMIPWGCAQVFQDNRPIKLCKLAKCRSLDVDPSTYTLALEKGLRVLEALDRHVQSLTRRVHNVKRYYFDERNARGGGYGAERAFNCIIFAYTVATCH